MYDESGDLLDPDVDLAYLRICGELARSDGISVSGSLGQPVVAVLLVWAARVARV